MMKNIVSKPTKTQGTKTVATKVDEAVAYAAKKKDAAVASVHAATAKK